MAKKQYLTIKAPPGRPCWVSQGDLSLVYLGWGQRDFGRFPVRKHYDNGTHFYLVLKGDMTLAAGEKEHAIAAPCACIIDRECLFGISKGRSAKVEILVWVWRESPALDALKPPVGGLSIRPLQAASLLRIVELHQRFREEVARADVATSPALAALRTLLEVELVRASEPPVDDTSRQWALMKAWISANLAIHAPIPALCDYLGMSPSTLNRFFLKQSGLAPGAYFRTAKKQEALRLIQSEGWTVKSTAYHLGYRHATDLSRALAD